MKKILIIILAVVLIHLDIDGRSFVDYKQQETNKSQLSTAETVDKEVTLVLCFSNCKCIIIHTDKKGVVRISAGNLKGKMHDNWNDNTFYFDGFYLEEEYQLEPYEMEKLNLLLSDETSIHKLNKNETKGGLEYYIYLSGRLCYKQAELPEVLMCEFPDLRITKTPRDIIILLTERIDNYFKFDTE